MIVKMLYEITQDCRIANREYKKGDIVTLQDTGQYFTTVMRPVEKAPHVESPKAEKAPEIVDEIVDENLDDVDGNVDGDLDEIVDENDTNEGEKPAEKADKPVKKSKKK